MLFTLLVCQLLMMIIGTRQNERVFDYVLSNFNEGRMMKN
jgi:hypothetical protein